jgi:hypothetical protein
LNPEAGKNLDPVEGLDGQAARVTMEKYRQSFSGTGEGPVYETPITLGSE